MGHRTLAPSTRAAHPPVDIVAGRLQFVDATIDRAARDPRRQGRCRDAAKAQRQGLIGRKQAPPPLVKKLDRSPIPRPDVIYINHFDSIAEPAESCIS